MPDHDEPHSRALSSRVQRGTRFFFRSVMALAFTTFLSNAAVATESPRPKVLAIAFVHFYSTNVEGTRGFYEQVLGNQGSCNWCEEVPRSPLAIPLSLTQILVLQSPPNNPPANLLYEIDFMTDNKEAMKNYLEAKNIRSEKSEPHANKKKDSPDGSLVVLDPEGHRIGFFQFPARVTSAQSAGGAMHLIHAGFVVHDRAAEDKFYKDILGFHVYWHGGMKDDEDNWVDMQVPDGTDWIEYMLKVPDNASHKTLGVMNHLALGVPDIHKAQEQLIKNGWKGTEEPKIGRDGKWQLNLYDPDETRVELMEFTPTKEPCCAPYTGPHPRP